jgi:hypothetical protein
MNQRFLMWGLTSIAFVATLAISAWQQGLWPAEDVTPRVSHPIPIALASAESTPMPLRPFAPANPAPATAEPAIQAVATPQPQAPEQQPTPAPAEVSPPSMPTAVPDVDEEEFLAHRDRAAQRGSRSR